VAVWLLLAPSAWAQPPSRQDPLGPAPVEGVLLLTNGEVLQGKVSRIADQYHVVLPVGEIRVRMADAEGFCRDLEDGYRFKRTQIAPGQIDSHLALAQWCLRHGLTGHASGELAEALALNPLDPRIATVQRRLDLALRKPASPAPPPRDPSAPTNDELDRLVQSLSPRTVESFTTAVQPLLLNHCAAGGCHAPSSPARLRLLRMPGDRPPTRRLTQRNLHAVLGAIDRQAPAESPLLAAATQPHGGATAAVFTSRDAAKVRQLTAWVQAVAAAPPAPRAASIEPAPPLGQTSAGGSGNGPEGAPSPPADPLDPAPFNRRFFPDEPDR
jgi:hypothetical protein